MAGLLQDLSVAADDYYFGPLINRCRAMIESLADGCCKLAEYNEFLVTAEAKATTENYRMKHELAESERARDADRADAERRGMELAASLFDGVTYGPYMHPAITIRDAIAIKWPNAHRSAKPAGVHPAVDWLNGA